MANPGKTAHQKAMGQRLKQLREALDLTQAAFGEWAQVGATTIAGWESGRNMIDLVHLAWAADGLGFTVDFIAKGDIGGLRHDLAVKLQSVQRRALEAGPPVRGRPARRGTEASGSPLVRDVPDAGAKPPRSRMHEPSQQPFLGKPPTRPV